MSTLFFIEYINSPLHVDIGKTHLYFIFVVGLRIQTLSIDEAQKIFVQDGNGIR